MTEFEIEESDNAVEVSVDGFEVKVRSDEGGSGALLITPQGFIDVSVDDGKTVIDYLDHVRVEIEGIAKQNPSVTVDANDDRTDFEVKD